MLRGVVQPAWSTPCRCLVSTHHCGVTLPGCPASSHPCGVTLTAVACHRWPGVPATRSPPGTLPRPQMREREERRRAEAYGDVPIRLYLPDGATVLQAALPATAPLSELLALARAALAPGAAAGAFLFTTPPRAVLKDLSPSLYAAKLVPAAKVHVAVDAGKAAAGAGSTAEQLLVRPEVLALAEQPPERSAVMHTAAQQQQQPATGAAASGSAVAGGAAGSSRATGAAQVQKGVPKWLKLGGK